MTFRLILLRHGESQGNAADRFTGRIDAALTRVGEAEARAAAHIIADQSKHVDIAFTSVQQRSRQTCAIVLRELGASPSIYTNPALNERDYGQLTGMTKTEANRIWGNDHVENWRRSYEIAPPGGESLRDTLKRVQMCYFNEILPQAFEDAIVLLVAHGNSLRALIMLIEQTLPEKIPLVEVPRCLPMTYEINGQTGRRQRV